MNFMTCGSNVLCGMQQQRWKFMNPYKQYIQPLVTAALACTVATYAYSPKFLGQNEQLVPQHWAPGSIWAQTHLENIFHPSTFGDVVHGFIAEES